MNATLVRRLVGGACAVLVLAALLALASRPTGAASPEAAVGSDARVSVRRDVGAVAVLLTVRHGDLALVVAYHESKGWFSAPVDPVPRAAQTSWTATRGGGSVPALSAAYGRAAGGTVRVTWDDKRIDTVSVGSDGLWLAARDGRAHISQVDRVGADGSVTSEPAP